MPYLLDTHSLIWFFEGSPKLPDAIRAIIADPENDIFLSIASLWEMAIKINLGKLTLAQPLEKVIERLPEESIFLLDITPKQVLQVMTLPLHHRDPFDRMLVAQALSLDFTLVSNEEVFDGYGVKRVW
jgi:PIN domain nuclease of toxin-antitoxin system